MEAENRDPGNEFGNSLHLMYEAQLALLIALLLLVYTFFLLSLSLDPFGKLRACSGAFPLASCVTVPGWMPFSGLSWLLTALGCNLQLAPLASRAVPQRSSVDK